MTGRAGFADDISEELVTGLQRAADCCLLLAAATGHALARRRGHS